MLWTDGRPNFYEEMEFVLKRNANSEYDVFKSFKLSIKTKNNSKYLLTEGV